MENLNTWHEQAAYAKPEKVVVKKRTPDGSFHKSIIIPTVMYPLNGKYEVFTYQNTIKLNTDYLPAVDAVRYKVGHCYENSEAVYQALRQAGANVNTYVGWLFVGPHHFPVHHCWCVVDGKSVVDLTDDLWLMLSQREPGDLSLEASRDMVVNFAAETKDLPNSLRCAPVGIPAPILYYVGCPCSPEQGREIYRGLIRRFPDHEILKKVDAGGLNRTQRMLADRGLFG